MSLSSLFQSWQTGGARVGEAVPRSKEEHEAPGCTFEGAQPTECSALFGVIGEKGSSSTSSLEKTEPQRRVAEPGPALQSLFLVLFCFGRRLSASSARLFVIGLSLSLSAFGACCVG